MDTFITEQRTWSRHDVAQMLVSRTALTELDQASALMVVECMQARRFKAGTVLIQEGMASTSFMILLLRGEVVVELENVKKADTVILSVAGPGSILGEMGLLDGEPRSATCTAFSEIDAAVLDRQALAELMASHPDAASKLLAVLFKRVSERLRSANRKLRSLTQMNASLQAQLDASMTMTAGAGAPPAGKPRAPADDSGMILL